MRHFLFLLYFFFTLQVADEVRIALDEPSQTVEELMVAGTPELHFLEWAEIAKIATELKPSSSSLTGEDLVDSLEDAKWIYSRSPDRGAAYRFSKGRALR